MPKAYQKVAGGRGSVATDGRHRSSRGVPFALFAAIALSACDGGPPLDAYEFQNGAGGRSNTTFGCTVGSDSYDACVNDLLYESAGKFLAVVEQRFTDGSALCDNLNVRVGTCDLQTELELIRQPKKQTYRHDDTVEFRVRLKNKSTERDCGMPGGRSRSRVAENPAASISAMRRRSTIAAASGMPVRSSNGMTITSGGSSSARSNSAVGSF